MRRECGNGRQLFIAETNGLSSVATIFGSEHAFLLLAVEVAERPAVVAALLEKHQFFRRQFGAALGGIQIRPILIKLVATMLGCEDAACAIEIDAFRVAQPGRIAL